MGKLGKKSEDFDTVKRAKPFVTIYDDKTILSQKWPEEKKTSNHQKQMAKATIITTTKCLWRNKKWKKRPA